MSKLLYGLELEMFFVNKGKTITVPQHGLPLDGCGAIVELRSEPHESLYDSTFEINKCLKEYYDKGINLQPVSSSGANRHEFTREEWRTILQQQNKDLITPIRSVYNEEQRELPKRVIAVSLQLNISNEIAAKYVDEEHRVTYARYGLLDIHNIVTKLDEEFAAEIRKQKRVAGEYAIKDGIRLEYRSLPSTAFFHPEFEKRVLKVMETIE